MYLLDPDLCLGSVICSDPLELPEPLAPGLELGLPEHGLLDNWLTWLAGTGWTWLVAPALAVVDMPAANHFRASSWPSLDECGPRSDRHDDHLPLRDDRHDGAHIGGPLARDVLPRGGASCVHDVALRGVLGAYVRNEVLHGGAWAHGVDSGDDPSLRGALDGEVPPHDDGVAGDEAPHDDILGDDAFPVHDVASCANGLQCI